MRLTLLCIFTFISCVSPLAQAQSSNDGGDHFVTAYMKAQQAEKMEQSGNLKGALSAYKEAARELDVIMSKYPSWNPPIVEFRKTRTTEAIVRLQEKLGRSGGGIEPEPALPRSGDGNNLFTPPTEIPPLEVNPPTPSRARRGKTQGDEGIGDIADRVKKLQSDLETAQAQVHNLTEENASIQRQLQEAAKARLAAENQQEILKGRADAAEKKLFLETNSGKASAEKIAVLSQEVASAKKQVTNAKIKEEADELFRKQLSDRYAAQLARIGALTHERDDAKNLSASVPGKIEAIQKQLDATNKEKQELATRLRNTETQLTSVTEQRDDAIAQVVKLKEAQKQVDKLVADNATLMAKLSDAQKSIAGFKAEGVEKDKQIDALKKRVGSLGDELARTKKESADYQKKMGDLQEKLQDSAKQLAAAKTENTETAAEKKKMQDENVILRGIVLRQQKAEAERAAMKKVVLGELNKMEINSKSLLKQIDFLSQPVVRLTPKERGLFKKPELQVSDTEISILLPKGDETSPVAANTQTPAVDATVAPAPVPAANAPAPNPPAPTTNVPTPPVNPPTPPAPAPATPEISVPDTKVAEQTTPQPKPAATPKKGTGRQAKAATPAPAPAPAPAVASNPAKPELPDMAKNDAVGKPSISLDARSAAPSLELSGNTSGTSDLFGGKPPEKSAGPGKNTDDATPLVSPDAMQAGGNMPNVPPDLIPLAKQGKDLFDRGKYLEAENIYRKILVKAPRNLYTLSNLGVVLFRSGKLKLSEEAFNKAIAVAPEDGFSHCTLGIVYYQETKLDEAVNELTKALAINPKNASAHNYLGITASQKGWSEAAQKELETAVSLDPNYADAYFNLAVVYATQHPPNKEEARKAYKRAIELGAEADPTLEQMLK